MSEMAAGFSCWTLYSWWRSILDSCSPKSGWVWMIPTIISPVLSAKLARSGGLVASLLRHKKVCHQIV